LRVAKKTGCHGAQKRAAAAMGVAMEVAASAKNVRYH
jgi:hypothetical protein